MQIFKSWIISWLVGAFLLFDSLSKIMGAKQAVDGTVALGFSAATVPLIGFALLIATVLYLVPRTSLVGGIVLAGYLGGAIASQVIAHQSPAWFPFVFAIIAWIGLYTRSESLRRMLRGR